MYPYHASLTPSGEGTTIIAFPDVPGAMTEGGDRDDLNSLASEALGIMLRHYAARDGALPAAIATDGPLIEPSLPDTLQIALNLAFAESGITKTELAARLGCKENIARRILDPDHRTKVATLENALSVLGMRARLAVEAA